MAGNTLGIEVDGANDVIAELESAADPGDEVGGELESFARDLLDEFVQTSPVDTGEYRSSWSMERRNKYVVLLKNDADHAPYLVYPNSQMVGARGANSRGILHNVRGMTFEKKSEFRDAIEAGVERAADR